MAGRKLLSNEAAETLSSGYKSEYMTQKFVRDPCNFTLMGQ
jgi:hypothetical protein